VTGPKLGKVYGSGVPTLSPASHYWSPMDSSGLPKSGPSWLMRTPVASYPLPQAGVQQCKDNDNWKGLDGKGFGWKGAYFQRALKNL